MPTVADRLAAKSGRKEDENARVRSMIDAARNEIKMAEALGSKPLYA